MFMIPYAVIYVLSYVIWSVYLKFNPPAPDLGIICFLISTTLTIIGLWNFLPSHFLAKEEFRRKLKIFILLCFWVVMMVLIKEFLSVLFVKAPVEFQFLVPFMIAGCREFYKRVQSKTVARMMVEKDETASALIAMNTSTHFSFFISIKLVGAEFSTICSTVVIDFALHLKATIEIIKELRKVNEVGNLNLNQAIKTKITYYVYCTSSKMTKCIGITIAVVSVALVGVTTALIIVCSGGNDEENQNSSQAVTIGQINQKFEATSNYNLMCTLFGSVCVIALLTIAILAKHHFDRQHHQDVKTIYQI